MKFQLKCRDWMAGLVPLALCCVLVAFDILSQQTLSRLSLGGWAYQMQQSLCWGLMLSSLAFFLGNWARWFYLPLFLLLLVTDVAETYVRWQFGVNFKGDWMLVLQASSPSELYNFWIDNVWSLIGSGLMLLGAGVVIAWLTWCARYPRRSARNFIVGLAFLLPMLMINCRGNPLHRAFGAAIFHQVVSDSFANVRMFKDLGVVHGNPEGLSDVKLSVSLDKAPTCVIVIGESATRNNFGIYGYERDTTPFLSSIRDELCVFQDLVGVWNNTPPAIRFLFTGATADDKNHARMMITQAAKKAGYPQAFVSNQGRWGHMNNTITYIFDTADSCVFLEDLKLPKPYYDDALLPHLDKALASSSGGQVVYLHQSGSHYPFRGLYPTNQAPFGVTRTIDHYDNTVHFTDGVIREVVTRLKALHRPAMMFYVSDHGDTPRAKSWRSFDDKDLWELPMVVWFSEEYKSSFPDTVAAVEKATALPLQSDQILPGLLKMMQIDGWADSASEKCFLNPVFKPRKVRMIKNWSEPYKKLNR